MFGAFRQCCSRVNVKAVGYQTELIIICWICSKYLCGNSVHRENWDYEMNIINIRPS